MTCLLIFIGHYLAVIRCEQQPEVWIEPEKVAVIAYYLPHPPKWGWDGQG